LDAGRPEGQAIRIGIAGAKRWATGRWSWSRSTAPTTR
jgi:hypothetical protein